MTHVLFVLLILVTGILLLVAGGVHLLVAVLKQRMGVFNTDRRHSSFKMEYSIRLIMAAGLVLLGTKFLNALIYQEYPHFEIVMPVFCVALASAGFALEALESTYKSAARFNCDLAKD